MITEQTRFIAADLTLTGERLALLPLDELHFPELLALASDQRIWEFYTVNGGNPQRLLQCLYQGIEARDKGTEFPFIIVDLRSDRIIGSTRYLFITPEHKKLEIGWTWFHPDYWATGLNTESKYLLLRHCFEELNLYRVQWQTDEINMRSRKAIEKIGGKFEGILRNFYIRDNGTHRHSAFFAMTDSDWPEAKKNLQNLLTSYGYQSYH